MEVKDLYPDLCTYNIFIDSLCKKEKNDQAYKLLSEYMCIEGFDCGNYARPTRHVICSQVIRPTTPNTKKASIEHQAIKGGKIHKDRHCAQCNTKLYSFNNHRHTKSRIRYQVAR